MWEINYFLYFYIIFCLFFFFNKNLLKINIIKILEEIFFFFLEIIERWFIIIIKIIRWIIIFFFKIIYIIAIMICWELAMWFVFSIIYDFFLRAWFFCRRLRHFFLLYYYDWQPIFRVIYFTNFLNFMLIFGISFLKINFYWQFFFIMLEKFYFLTISYFNLLWILINWFIQKKWLDYIRRKNKNIKKENKNKNIKKENK